MSAERLAARCCRTSALAVAFWRAWTQGRKRDYLWSGAWLALALYTHLAARLLLGVILLFVGVELLADLMRRRRNGEPLWPTWKQRLASWSSRLHHFAGYPLPPPSSAAGLADGAGRRFAVHRRRRFRPAQRAL
jgi:hypothetical protein